MSTETTKGKKKGIQRKKHVIDPKPTWQMLDEERARIIKRGSFKARSALFITHLRSVSEDGADTLSNEEEEDLMRSFKTEREQRKILEIYHTNKVLEFQMINIVRAYLEFEAHRRELRGHLLTLETIVKMERMINRALESIKDKGERVEAAKRIAKSEKIRFTEVDFNLDGFIEVKTGYGNKGEQKTEPTLLSSYIGHLTERVGVWARTVLSRTKVFTETLNRQKFKFESLQAQAECIADRVIDDTVFPVKEEEIEPVMKENNLIPKFTPDDFDDSEYRGFKDIVEGRSYE